MNRSDDHTYSELSDEQLLVYLKYDKEGALSELFNRYWKKLYVYIKKLSQDEVLSEESVQQILVDIWERRHVLEIRNLEAYLIQAAKYQVAARLKPQHITHFSEIWIDTVASPLPNPEEEFLTQETKSKLTQLVHKLPDKCRKIFILSRFEQLSNKEIAKSLGISVRTVEKQVSKAIRFLRTNLSREL